MSNLKLSVGDLKLAWLYKEAFFVSELVLWMSVKHWSWSMLVKGAGPWWPSDIISWVKGGGQRQASVTLHHGHSQMPWLLIIIIIIIYPIPNFNGATVEIWEWISNFTPHLTRGGWGCEVSCGRHHRPRGKTTSSGWSSVWHRSNTGLSSTQYEQIPIILGVWPFWLTPFFFRSKITFWRAYG